MTDSDLRLHALAELELADVSLALPSQDPVQEMLAAGSEARSLFLMTERDVGEARAAVTRYVDAWRRFLPEARSAWNSVEGAQANEYRWTLCEVLSGGLQAVLARGDGAPGDAFSALGEDGDVSGEDALSGTLRKAQALCWLHEGEFQAVTRMLEERWEGWVELKLEDADDDEWRGLRGIAVGDAALVTSAMHGMARSRQSALHRAVQHGSMLRNTVPVHLALQTSGAAMAVLARRRGLHLDVTQGPLLTPRALALWQPEAQQQHR